VALFGKKKPAAPAPPPPSDSGGGGGGAPNPAAAISKLRDTVETLEKREEHLYRKIDKEVQDAKKLSQAGKKQQALACIKRKKMYEKQLEQISGAKMTIETQRVALEGMNINAEVIAAQKAGAASMQAQVKQMGGVDAVDDTMDAVEEGLADANEIGEAMGRAVNAGLDQDDDDLLAELEELEQDDLTAGLADTSDMAAALPDAGLSMPAAPSAPMQKKEMTEEERELAELEASMAM